ncbi:uncharacterized protein LOC100178304 isoform X2 [Ciona intestinalis]
MNVAAEGHKANARTQEQEMNLEMEQTNAGKVANTVDVHQMNERRASEQVVKSIIWEDVMSSVMGGVKKSETSSSSSSSEEDLSQTKSEDDDCSSSASSGSFPLPPPSLFPPKSPEQPNIYDFEMRTDDSDDNEEFPPPPNASTLSPTFPPPPPPTPAVVTDEKLPKLDIEVLRVGKDLIHVESYEPKVHTHVETLPAEIEIVTLGRDVLHLEMLDEEKAKVIGKHSVETVCEEVVTIPEGVGTKEMQSNEEGTKMEEVSEENKYLVKTSEVVLDSAENFSQTGENVQEICESGNVAVLAEVLDDMDSNVEQEKGSVIGKVHITGGSLEGVGHVLAGGDGLKDVSVVEATSDDHDDDVADKHKDVVSIETTTSDEHEGGKCNVSDETAKEGSGNSDAVTGSDDRKYGVVTVGKDVAKEEGFKVDVVAVATGFDNNDGGVSIKEIKTDERHELVSNKHLSDETNKEEGFKVGVNAVATGYGFDDHVVSVGEDAGRGGESSSYNVSDKTTRTSHKVDGDSHCKVVSYGHKSRKFFLADSSSNGGLMDDGALGLHIDGVSSRLYAVNAEKTDPDVEVCDDVATKEVVDTNHKDPVGTSGSGKQNHRDVVRGNEYFRMETVQGASKENIETTKTEHVSAIKMEEITVSDEFKSKASSITSEEKTSFISVKTTLASKIEPKPIDNFSPKVSIKKTPKVKSVFSAFEKIKLTDDSSSEDDVPKLASHSKFLFDQKRSMFEASPQQSAPKTTKPFFKPGKLKFKTEQNIKVFKSTETSPTKSPSKTTEISPAKKQVKFQPNVGKLSDKKSDSGIQTSGTLSDGSVEPSEDKAASIEKTEPKIPTKPVQNKPFPTAKPTSPKSGVNLFAARPFTSPTFGSSPIHPRPISPPVPKSLKPVISPKPTLHPKPSYPPLPPVIPPLPDVQDEEMDNIDEGSLKPTDDDFILPPLPPPPSDAFLNAQQPQSNYSKVNFNPAQKVRSPTSPTSKGDFPPPPTDLPPPPSDLLGAPKTPPPHEQSKLTSAKPFTANATAKGFRSVSFPVSKSPTPPTRPVLPYQDPPFKKSTENTAKASDSGNTEKTTFNTVKTTTGNTEKTPGNTVTPPINGQPMMRTPTPPNGGYVTLLRDTRQILIKPTNSNGGKVENSTKVTIHGTPFPTPPGASVEVTPEHNLPGGAVYQTTTKEGDLYHTDTYYPASNPGDPQAVVLERTKTTTLVKAPHHEGIGPTTGTGVPVALKSSVDDSKHWYKSMFKQMHKIDGNEDTPETNGSSSRPMSADSSNGRHHVSMETERPTRVGKITDYKPAEPYVVENKPIRLNLNHHQPPPPRTYSVQGNHPCLRRSSSLEDFSQQDWQEYFDDILKPKSPSKIWDMDVKKQMETTVPTSSTSYTSPHSKMSSYHSNATKQPITTQYKRESTTDAVKRNANQQQRKSQGDGIRQPAKAKFDFNSRTGKELSVKRGQTVIITRRVDDNWYMTETPDGVKSGIIPVEYLKVITSSSQPDKPTRHGQAKAKFDFNGKTKNELSFKKGDDLVLLKRVDDNWYKGKLGPNTGILPVGYVQVTLEPETKQTKKETIPKQLEVSPRSSHSQQSSTISQTSLDSSEPDENEKKNRAAFLAHSVVGHTPALASNHRHRGEFDLTELDQVIDQSTATVAQPKPTNIEVHYDYPKPVKPQSPKPPPTQQTLPLPTVPSYPSSTSSQPSTPRAISPPAPDIDYGQIIGRYVALYAYESSNEDELDLCPGDVVIVVEICDDGWYVGTSERTGGFGTFPGNYVTAAQ